MKINVAIVELLSCNDGRNVTSKLTVSVQCTAYMSSYKILQLQSIY